jgi:serine/threonine protein kinase
MKESKINPNTNPQPNPTGEGKHFEVVKRFLEQKNEDAILECLETMDKKKKSIGVGKNAEVFAVEDEPMFENLCVKKVAKLPKVKINGIESEFEFQEEVNNLGIRTPRNIMVVRNTDTREEFIIMERIKGHSIGDITDLRSNIFVKDTYNHEAFFQELKEMVNKMHERRIYHRSISFLSPY